MRAGPGSSWNKDHILRSCRTDRIQRCLRGIPPVVSRKAMRLIHQPEDHLFVTLIMCRELAPKISQCGRRYLFRTYDFTEVTSIVVRIKNDVGAASRHIGDGIIQARELIPFQVPAKVTLQTLPPERKAERVHSSINEIIHV